MSTAARPEILQFGTSRFLLAHVDAFVGHSLAEGLSNKRVVVVQSSARPEGKAKARMLAEHRRYPVQVRGVRDGETIDRIEWVDSLDTCLLADEDWAELERRFCNEITHVVSNTGDRGFDPVTGDTPHIDVPASFPAKLAKLLHARHRQGGSGVTLMPCELISGNGQRLKSIVLDIARRSWDDAAFAQWLADECIWVDTLVDRIVSAALEPVGAVAEPYGLWAIQDIPGLSLPCRHPDVQVVADLAPYEKRKLHVLNLAHSYLVARWRDLGLQDEVRFVREAMRDPRLAEPLDAVLGDEVLPVLSREMPGLDLASYKATTLERFANPFLDHRLEDIAQNHEEKLRRRLLPVVEMARTHGLAVPALDACVAQLPALSSTGHAAQTP
ncbi:tagaturonate reductase [Modicisalibacter muralis]|uniref:Tagaturonate reductase n=1 Tax=Modicisalibacter muralis TaxID=119000 RepID=A0A1G9S5D3_9GAMM|nr:mannitol dehydrogenase family protein [Halomonas muralis]SDM30719.1 tagaturonate reductase [Halomonas muralis]